MVVCVGMSSGQLLLFVYFGLSSGVAVEGIGYFVVQVWY